MTEQLEMTMGARPEAGQDEVEWLVERLRGQGWRTAGQVLRSAGLPEKEDNKRWIREVASRSDGRIASGPGAPGYALTRELSPAELARINGMKDQGREMIRRWVRIMRRWHSGN